MKTKDSLCAVGIVLLSLIAVVAQPNPQGGPPPRHVKDELLVKFKGGPRGAAAEQARDRMKHGVKRHFDFIGWQQIRLPRGMSVEEGLALYRNLPGVLAVEPNGLMSAIEPVVPAVNFRPKGNSSEAAPDDPMFPQQWGLARIGASNAWAVTTGSTNVVVAIIDSGINYKHEDLEANMWRNSGEVPGNAIDADGLPDAWETIYPNAANPAADTDQDGLTNLQEYRAGTNPQDAQSYLRVENIAPASGANAVALRFVAAANKTYTVESRPAADAGAWTRLADIAASPTNRLVEILDTNGPPPNGQRFYRLATPRVP